MKDQAKDIIVLNNLHLVNASNAAKDRFICKILDKSSKDDALSYGVTSFIENCVADHMLSKNVVNHIVKKHKDLVFFIPIYHVSKIDKELRINLLNKAKINKWFLTEEEENFYKACIHSISQNDQLEMVSKNKAIYILSLISHHKKVQEALLNKKCSIHLLSNKNLHESIELKLIEKYLNYDFICESSESGSGGFSHFIKNVNGKKSITAIYNHLMGLHDNLTDDQVKMIYDLINGISDENNLNLSNREINDIYDSFELYATIASAFLMNENLEPNMQFNIVNKFMDSMNLYYANKFCSFANSSVLYENHEFVEHLKKNGLK